MEFFAMFQAVLGMVALAIISAGTVLLREVAK